MTIRGCAGALSAVAAAPEERLAELSGITIRCVAVALQEHEEQHA